MKTLYMIVIALFFGTGFGFLMAVTSGATLDGHDHDSHDHSGHDPGTTDHGDGHDHSAMVALPADLPPPQFEITLTEEPGGWNLYLDIRDFRFAPERVNGAHVAGEGHAHVYVDGEKLARIYGPWFHIPSLPEGAEVLTVTLNANDHRMLSAGGRALSVSCRLPDCVALGDGDGG